MFSLIMSFTDALLSICNGLDKITHIGVVVTPPGRATDGDAVNTPDGIVVLIEMYLHDFQDLSCQSQSNTIYIYRLTDEVASTIELLVTIDPSHGKLGTCELVVDGVSEYIVLLIGVGMLKAIIKSFNSMFRTGNEYDHEDMVNFLSHRKYNWKSSQISSIETYVDSFQDLEYQSELKTIYIYKFTEDESHSTIQLFVTIDTTDGKLGTCELQLTKERLEYTICLKDLSMLHTIIKLFDDKFDTNDDGTNKEALRVFLLDGGYEWEQKTDE
jgi:hypothetical protein